MEDHDVASTRLTGLSKPRLETSQQERKFSMAAGLMKIMTSSTLKATTEAQRGLVQLINQARMDGCCCLAFTRTSRWIFKAEDGKTARKNLKPHCLGRGTSDVEVV